MEISHMAIGIIKIIDSRYNEHIDEECIDIMQIKNICNLYKTKPKTESKDTPDSGKSPISAGRGNSARNTFEKSSTGEFSHMSNEIENTSLGEIIFSSPEFKKISGKTNKKNQSDILKSNEFMKKYIFFIKILYVCLKIQVDLFDINENIITLKNNYQLLKTLEIKKKQLIMDHIDILKIQHKNISQKIGLEYETYQHNYIIKIKIIDKILYSINKLIKSNIFEKTDNLLTLILPYFYTYTEFIEEYN